MVPALCAFAGRSVEGTRLFIEDQPGWQLVAVLKCGGLGSTRSRYISWVHEVFLGHVPPNSSMDDHDSVLKQPAGDCDISFYETRISWGYNEIFLGDRMGYRTKKSWGPFSLSTWFIIGT